MIFQAKTVAKTFQLNWAPGQEVVLIAFAAEVLKVGDGLVLECAGVTVLIGRGPMLVPARIFLDSLHKLPEGRLLRSPVNFHVTNGGAKVVGL